MSVRPLIIMQLLLAVLPTVVQATSFSEVVAQAEKQHWRPIDAENTLYLQLPQGRVVIELAPEFAPNHVANIKTLAQQGYYDGLAIVRSHDNYVVQWADPNADTALAKTLGAAKVKLAAEYWQKYPSNFEFTVLPDHDGYAPEVGFSKGFTAGRDEKSQTTWLTHCYGAVGVSRDVADDSGNGSSLYVVTGHAPRHLDRNITVVGRVVLGMELLSTVPRGNGPLGFYQDPASYTPLISVIHAATLPISEQLKLEVLRSDSKLFERAVESLRNRSGPWYKRPAGYVGLCNIPVPIRQQP
mgnify:CR=1 FL=1